MARFCAIATFGASSADASPDGAAGVILAGGCVVGGRLVAETGAAVAWEVASGAGGGEAASDADPGGAVGLVAVGFAFDGEGEVGVGLAGGPGGAGDGLLLVIDELDEEAEVVFSGAGAVVGASFEAEGAGGAEVDADVSGVAGATRRATVAVWEEGVILQASSAFALGVAVTGGAVGEVVGGG